MTWEEYAGQIARLKARVAALEREVFICVAAARAAGISWQQIGDALGVSRQSAWEKYGKRQ